MDQHFFSSIMAQKTDRRSPTEREEFNATLERYTGRSLKRKVGVVLPDPSWDEMYRPPIAPQATPQPMDSFVLPRAFRHVGRPGAPPSWAMTRIGELVPGTAWRHTARIHRNPLVPPVPLSIDDHELPLYAAYLLAGPAYTWTPQEVPLVQTATWETLCSHVVSAPWDLGYEYAQDAPQSNQHGTVMIHDVPRLIIRTITTVTLAPVYEYVLVQGIPETADIVHEPIPLAHQEPSKTSGQRKLPEYSDDELRVFLDQVEKVVQDYRQELKNPQSKDPTLAEIVPRWPPPGTSGSTLYRKGKAAMKLVSFPSLQAWIKALPHRPRS